MSAADDDLVAKEEARLKRLAEKGKGNVFGGGLTAAQNRGRKLSGGASTAPTHSAPMYKPVVQQAPPSRPYQNVVRQEEYHPPAREQRGPAYGEVVEESYINPSKVFDPVEEASKEEERMMKSIGKFARPETNGGSASYNSAARAPTTTTSYQPPRGPPPSSQIRTTTGSAYSSYSAPTNYEEEELALPMPTRATSSRAPSSQPAYSTSYSASKPSNFVYPQFKVQQLIPADNGTANVLPIGDLACQLSELTIGLKNDGKTVELRRSVTENGQPKNESQLFNLPYQVTGGTCSATYHAGEGNGTLKIKLGKVMSGQAPRGERQLLQFRTYANPSSNSDRVQIEIDQQPEFYKFFPGAPSRFDTDFVVVLNGQALEFKSTYSVDESEGSVKTITGTQKVQLPLMPTLDQIDVSDDSVTIWPTRSAGGPVHVPDQQVQIVNGY